jgi:hypothetical protein
MRRGAGALSGPPAAKLKFEALAAVRAFSKQIRPIHSRRSATASAAQLDCSLSWSLGVWANSVAKAVAVATLALRVFRLACSLDAGAELLFFCIFLERE